MLASLKIFLCTGRLVLRAVAQVVEHKEKFLMELFDRIEKQNGGKAHCASNVELGAPFVYRHLGSMASVGGYKALVDLLQSKDGKVLLLAGFVETQPYDTRIAAGAEFTN